MNRYLPYLAAGFLVLAVWACGPVGAPAPTPVTPTPTPTDTTLPPEASAAPPTTGSTAEPPTATAVPAPPSEAAACMVMSGADDVNIYTRPNIAADVFAPLSLAELPLEVFVRTADGWLGFDPGVAQAANLGVFRYRWINSAEVTTEGTCDSLPEVVGPLPGICYDQPMEDAPVYDVPDPGGRPIATLHPEQYAALTGRLADDSWYRVDLSIGNNGASGIGWVAGTTINVNGPCDTLEIVSP